MPLLDKYIIPNHEGIIGIWEYADEMPYFESQMELYPAEIEELSTLKARKRQEWLSSRYLLHLMSDRNIRGACLKDKYGKPYLVDSSYFISMSHSHNRTVVLASPHVVGVDIQFMVPKIERIAKRFLSEDELSQIKVENQLEMLHIYWGAKESVFKAFGRKELDFRKHIMISPFEFHSGLMRFTGTLIKEDYHKTFDIYAKKMQEFMLVYAIEN